MSDKTLNQTMRPAFLSIKPLIGFTLLLLFLVIAPWLTIEKILPGPDDSYSCQTIRFEKFPWVQKFIFDETNDIDIAFIGSSHIGYGINTPYVQQKLDQTLQRKTTVRTISWFEPGYDALYFFTRDLLSRRHVNMLVFYDECNGSNFKEYYVHTYLPQWYFPGSYQDVLAASPWRCRMDYYYASIVSTPRIILAHLTANMRVESTPDLTGKFAIKHSVNPEFNLGCVSATISYIEPLANGFSPLASPSIANSNEVFWNQGDSMTNFQFSDRPLPATQIYFAREFIKLVQSHGCQLIQLHIPMYRERRSSVMNESLNMSKLVNRQISLVGIPGEKLFHGLSDVEVGKLFYDQWHLNINGQRYFTPLITPALIKFYEKQSQD